MPQRPVKSNRFCHQFYESAVQPTSDILREIDIFLKKERRYTFHFKIFNL